MTNTSVEGLPPEMQQRIADLVAKAQSGMPQTQAPVAQPPQPPAKPNLMDHTIALRQEVDMLNHRVAAMAQVVDAVGQAVSQLYGMFQQQTTPSNYSTAFQAQKPSVEDSDY